MKSTFDSIRQYLQEVKAIKDLTPKEIKLLSEPQRIKKTNLKVSGKTFPAWRILYNDALGPGKGGVRFHPQANQDEVQSLAFWMMIKDSLAGLPYGGAKGAVQFNPKKASLKLREDISRKFIDAFYQFLGEDKDVPAPDVYTNSQVMAWMLDEYEKKVGHHEPAMITGKPLVLGGCRLRNDATAKGGFFVIKEMIKTFRLQKRHLTIALQGFGNAGSYLAQMLDKDHFKVVAVSDSQGGIYQEKGLNIEEVRKVKAEKSSVIYYSPGEKITNKDILTLPVDILILAALENQITAQNAHQVKAPYVVEIANGPVTYDADQQLLSNNVVVVPDVLANSGGVIVSYFEWAQNKTGNILDENYLAKILKNKMVYGWKQILAVQKENHRKISLKTAAYLIAIERILSAEKLRGRL